MPNSLLFIESFESFVWFMLQTEHDDCQLEEENPIVEMISYESDDDPFDDVEEEDEEEQQEMSTETLQNSIDMEKSNGLPNATEKCFRFDTIKCEFVSIVLSSRAGTKSECIVH